MPFPNVSDIVATTIEHRSKKVADNVTKNNIILAKMSQKGRIKTFSGGSKILEELSFAENTNAGWYSGYDILPVGVSDVISAAEFGIKQAAVPVTVSGLEGLQNAGKEAMIDLLDSRLNVAESTMQNLISQGLYSDGAGGSGKQIEGLAKALPVANNSGSYGGIDRSTTVGTFWRHQVVSTATGNVTSATIQGFFNDMWSKQVRGADRPDLILCDNNTWKLYTESLQSLQRFSSADTGSLGFPTLKYMDADVYFDGGIGGFCDGNTAYFLNTNYLKYRPHSARNMVPLSPNKRYATNQDAEVQILGWAGNMTSCGQQFQGRFDFATA